MIYYLHIVIHLRMTLQNYPEYQEILNNIRFSYEQLSSLLVRLQDQYNRGPRVENETFINEIFARDFATFRYS